jgi:hypothetical protein
MKKTGTRTLRWYADAYPHLDFYYGGVSERKEGRIFSTIVANCQHHHQTREAAERCGERMLKDMPA